RYGNTLTDKIAEPFRDPTYNWYGIGVRGRVVLYNTKRIKPGHIPLSIAALTQPKWKDRCAMADPRLNGSARFHIKYLYDILGEEDTADLLQKMQDNGVQLLPNDAAVVDAVVSGKADWGVVDSDVGIAAVRAGKPVDFTFVDQDPYVTGAAMGK